MNGIELIAAERQRQIKKEGWTPEHDAEHKEGELAAAAMCYTALAAYQAFRVANVRYADENIGSVVPVEWPWEDSWWKPKDLLSNLVRAGALIAAEIDRIQLVTMEASK